MTLDPRDLKSFVRMFTEVGVCVWCLPRFHDQLWLVPAVLTAYFGGNLLQALTAMALRRPLRGAGLLLPVALALVAAAMWAGALIPLLAALVATGFAMGVNWEPAAPGPRNRLVKIAAKLSGMMAAAVVVLGPLAFAAVAVPLAGWLVAIHLAGQTRSRRVEAGRWRRVDTINIFHQSAYFAFVYVFWAALPGAPAWTPALLFPIGWIGYWALELTMSGDAQPYRPRALGAGHVVVSLTVAAMSVAKGPAPLIFGWFVTGVGGGTCYTMERAAGGRPGRLSDDIGAVLGVASAALVLAWLPEPAAALMLSSAYALIAAVAALLPARADVQGGLAHADR